MNQASNSNMPRSTAEALKQIQKQGLSISVVVTDSRPLPSDSSVPKETRVKAAMPVEKASRIVVRSNAGEKTVMLQARSTATSPEIRNSGGQSSQHSNQVVFQESKVAVSKPNQPMVSTSDSRAFGNQTWSNQPVTLPSDSNKPQGISRSSHMISVVPDKTQASSMARVSQNTVYVENKLPVSRVVPVTTHDNKNQVRSVQMAAVPSKIPLNRGQNQHVSFDIKPQKSPLSSPPSEVKVLAANTAARPSKVYLPVHENKGVSSSHNMVSAASTEVKPSFASSSKVIGRGVEKSTVGVQRNITVKGILADKNSQIKPDSRSTVDQLSGSASAAASDRSANIAFRVATTLPKKTVEEKSSVKISRVSQSTESHNSVHLLSAKSETVSHGKLTSDSPLKAAMPPENSSDCSVTPAVFNTPVRGAAKRPLVAKVVCRPPLKKKCVKRVPDQLGVSTSEACTLSSDEGSPEKEKKFLNLKSPSDLTITPVRNSSTPSTSGSAKVPEKSSVYLAKCHNCKSLSSNRTKCDSCNAKITTEAIQYFQRKTKSGPSFVVTKNITTSIKKEIIYTTTTIPSDGMSENQSYHFKQAVEGQVTIEGNRVVSPRGKGRPRGRRKYAEPECYTLSSDEDENASMQFNSMLDDNSHLESQMYHGESDGSNLEHSSGSEHLQDENEEEMDDPMFPGVTEINEEQEEMECEGEGMEDEEEEEVDYSGEEEEVGEDEDSPHEDAELEDESTKGQKPTDYPLRCRSIRIGSYKVHPLMSNPCVPVTLASNCLTFEAPVLSQPTRIMSIKLKDQDIRHVMAHFGRCLPIMFIFTSASFGEAVRTHLNMTDGDPRYFDPTSKDEKTQKLTFLIENLTDDQRNFIRTVFPGDKKLKEMDQKTANEILVKSTPHQPTAVKLQSLNPVPTISVETLPPIPQKIICRTPVVNLFTYPPPPQTGGIAITNEDLACLNEGEFLNDAIIDFYLKYVFYEKLTPAQREKTHIFSSYFYPRLTHKPERPRSKDDAGKTMQVRRHEQVKTWTRHVDIFSKDFIIIPVNQNVHWFLAIICYPGRVPEAPEESVQPEPKGNKSADNVSSTVEQEEVQHKVVIKEISPNGDNSDQEENSNSNSDSSYQVEEPPDSDEPTAESPDSTTHPDGKKRDLPCICIFDSLCGPNRWRIASTLREYLEMEWKMKKGTKKVFDRNTMQGFIMKCPQQTNYSDCGTYVLQYVESFFENPIQFFRAPMPDLTNWFSEAKVSKKRQQLQELILSLQKKLSKNNPSNSTPRKLNQSESVPSSPASTLQTENR